MKILFLLPILVTLLFFISPVFAQESLISVQTDDNHYDEGDTIVVSGKITIVVGETPVTLQLFTEGNLVDIAKIVVAQDGTYSHTVLAEGPLWKNAGEYIVRISYQDQIAETEFSYTPKSESIETTANFEVDAGSNGTFDVEYTIKGGTVKDMIVDSDIFAMIVQIDSTDEGTITLDLPREFTGAEKQNGKDVTFIILIDGIEVAYQESLVHSNSRVITVNFEEGDSNIEIIGIYTIYNSKLQLLEACVDCSMEVYSQSLGMSITATADRNSDTITVTGQTVSDIADVTFRVTSPSGNNVVAIGQISPYDNGEFSTVLEITQMWREDGFYTITAMQSVVQNSLYTLSVEVEVINGMVVSNTSVTESNLDVGFTPNMINVAKDAGIEIYANYVKGSDIIKVRGYTDIVSQDITLTVTSPLRSIVSINKISPMLDGKYTFDVPVGGALWKYDGFYTVTVQQFNDSKYTASIEIDMIGFNEYIPNYSTPQETSIGYQGNVSGVRESSSYTLEEKLEEQKSRIGDDNLKNTFTNEPLQQENNRLKIENKQLKNEINMLNVQLDNLQKIISEQITVIMDILLELK